MSQKDLIDSIESGDIDFGFGIYRGFFKSYAWLELFVLDVTKLKLVVNKTHKFANRKSISIEELNMIELLNFDEKSEDILEMNMAQKGTHYLEYGSIKDHASGEILIRSGYGSMLWVDRLCDVNRYPELCFIDIDDFNDQCEVVLLWNKYNSNPVLNSFKNLIDNMYK